MPSSVLVHGFDRAKDRSVAGDIHRALREEILTCRLAPGQIITEPEIAKLFGVSRTPAGRALRQLQEEDLVRVVSGVGYMVSPLSEREYRETGQLWLVLETAAIQMACETASDSQLRDLAALVTDEAEAALQGILVDQENADRWFQHNTAFHVRLAKCSGNQLLARAMRRLLEAGRRYYHVGSLASRNMPLPTDYHKEIAQALLERNTAKAIAVSKQAISYT